MFHFKKPLFCENPLFQMISHDLAMVSWGVWGVFKGIKPRGRRVAAEVGPSGRGAACRDAMPHLEISLAKGELLNQ